MRTGVQKRVIGIVPTGSWTLKSGRLPAVVLLLIVAGCQQYRPLPLDSAAVEQALTPPGPEALRVRAETLEHPILEPLELNLQDGVSPDEAAVLAVLLNPSLRAARDERALAAAQLIRAGLLPNPELSLDFEMPTGGDTEGTVNAFGLGLSWNVLSLLTRPANVDQADAHRAAVEMDVAWQEWQVARNARAAVFQLVSLNRQIALQEETRRRSKESLVLFREAIASGARTVKDLSAAQVESRKADAALLGLRKQAGQQRLQLNRLLGLPPEHQVPLSDAVELPSSFAAPAASELLDSLEQRRLDLIALRRGYDSQEATVRSTILSQFPRLSLGPTVGRDIENVDTAGFGLSVDLPVFRHNKGVIAVEQATRQKLFDEYASRVFETRSDVEMLLSRIQFLNEEIAAGREAEPQLRSLVEEYHKALAAGSIDILTYLAAWNDMTSSHMNLLSLQEQLAQAIVDLEAATGLYHIRSADPKSASMAAPQEDTSR